MAWENETVTDNGHVSTSVFWSASWKDRCRSMGAGHLCDSWSCGPPSVTNNELGLIWDFQQTLFLFICCYLPFIYAIILT